MRRGKRPRGGLAGFSGVGSLGAGIHVEKEVVEMGKKMAGKDKRRRTGGWWWNIRFCQDLRHQKQSGK